LILKRNSTVYWDDWEVRRLKMIKRTERAEGLKPGSLEIKEVINGS